MDKYLKAINDKRLQKTLDALNANNIKAYSAYNPNDLHDMITLLIKDDVTASCGGSATLAETGVIDFLRKSHVKFYERSSGKTPEEVEELTRQAYFVDSYFTSANAITENGEIYCVDGNGNRTSAMIYGPKKVIIVAGFNKIVPDLETARQRVKKICAPANVARLGLDKECVRVGECVDCREVDKICNIQMTINFQRDPNRMKVIILPSSFGY